MEIVALVSIVLTCVCVGYIVGTEVLRRQMFADLKTKTDTLNVSIESFGKAYLEFNARALDIEARFATLEFKVNGEGMRASPRR